MKSKNIPFGKRLKSEQAETMFFRYPGSDDTETLPAGKPSPIIESYILQDGGYYALQREDEKRNIYLKDTDRLTVVPKDAPDQSSFFSQITGGFSDFFTNTAKDVTGPAKHLKIGFNEAIKDASKWVPAGPEALKSIILWVAIPIGGILVLMLLNNLSE